MEAHGIPTYAVAFHKFTKLLFMSRFFLCYYIIFKNAWRPVVVKRRQQHIWSRFETWFLFAEGLKQEKSSKTQNGSLWSFSHHREKRSHSQQKWTAHSVCSALCPWVGPSETHRLTVTYMCLLFSTSLLRRFSHHSSSSSLRLSHFSSSCSFSSTFPFNRVSSPVFYFHFVY